MTAPHRLTSTFDALRAGNRCGFVAYVMGGDPDRDACWELLRQLPDAGADIVELGFPFTDPMADGPSIQDAGLRALKEDTRLDDVLDIARRFRDAWPDTPLVLMGYANPIHHRGWGAFAEDAATAGVDAAIVVDLPPEEDAPLREALGNRNLSLIRLATPTTDAARRALILEKSTGFVYYVSVTGVTGAGTGAAEMVAAGLEDIRRESNLPVAVGFGVRTQDHASVLARHADAVVVGSAIVEALHEGGASAALEVVSTLAEAVHGARQGAAE